MKSHESSWQPLESLESRLMLSGDAPVIGFLNTPYAIAEGGSIQFDAGGSTDNETDPLTYSWDLNNDGTYGDSAEANPTFSWAQLVAAGIDDNGVYTIGLQLFDGSNTVTGTTTLTVANAAPTIALAGNAAVNESTAYTLNLGAVTDAGDDAPTSYIVDWGDGSDPNFYTTLGNKIHTYADNGNVTISVTVVDEDGMHAAAGTKAVTVNNIAPAVIGGATETLAAINEDLASGSNTGATVNGLFLVHYSDAADAFAGVAIVANTANPATEGAWQYSTDGGTTWTAVDAGVGPATAIVLDTAARIRFAPAANYHGTPGTLSVRLWDGSGDLVAGQANDVSGTIGGTGGLSADAVSLQTTINSLNDTPAFTSAALTDATEDAAYTYNITASDADGDGITLTGLTVPAWLTFTDNGDGTATLTGTPTNNEVGDHAVSLQASDGTALGTQSFTITVANTNDEPTVETPLVDQNATEDVPFSYQFAADAFDDVDAADTLVYTATLADNSALPAWLAFNGATRTFSGTPGNGDTGTISVKVTASDGTASISDTFDIAIAPVNDAPVITDPGAQSVAEDGTLTFSTANGTLVSIADVDLGGSELSVTLTVTDGRLDLAQTDGLTITGGADGTATVTFTGTAANVNAALDGMSYTPTADYNGGATLTVDVSDQGATGAGGTLTDNAVIAITVTAVDDAPVLDLDDSAGGVDYADTYTENGIALAIANADATLADVDSANLASLTVTITNAVDGDTLDADVTGTDITKDYNAATGVLTLSGADSVADYQAVLRTVTFVTASDDPTDTARTITFVANDGTSNSPVATTTLTVVVANDAPTLSANAGLTLDEGAAGAIASALLDVTDPDNTAAQITYTVTAVPTHGALKLDGVALANDDTFTQADVDAGLVTYVHDGGETTADAFTFTVSDGAAGIGATTFDVTVTPQNDDPVLSVDGGAVADTVALPDIAEDGTIVFQGANNNAITVADADAVDPISMTLAATKGTLELSGTGGLTNVVGDGGATVSFDGSAADINAALAGMTYTADADAEGAETITITLNDNNSAGAGGGADVVRTITFNITAVNDAPVLNNASNLTLTGINEDPVANTGMLVSDLIATGAGGDPISDVDAGAVEGIAVVGADDTNGTWEYSTDGGTTWTAFAPVAAGSAVLLATGANDRVRFVPDANYNGTATMTVRAWDRSDANTSGTTGVDTTTNGDGTAFSTATVTAQITVAAVNDAPSVNLDPGGAGDPDFATTWTEDGGAVAIVDAINAAVTDVDSANLASMTITIANFVAGDVLDANVGATGIVKNYNAGTGVLTLTGNTTKANYQTVLRSLTFTSTSEDPDTTARTVTIVANDGSANSATVTATVAMAAVNDVPVVNLDADGTGPDYTSAYTENAAATPIVDDVTISDADDATLASMTITITNVVSGDILDADTNGSSISKSYNSGTGVLSLTGVDTVANYRAVLQTLTFASISNDPTGVARTVTVVANDGTGDSAAATATVNVTAVNDVPSIGGVNGTSVSYTEGDAATPILSSVTVADSDDTNIESATIVVTNVVSGDVLAATVGASGLVADYTAGTGTLTLTGAATKAVYQTVLRTITFVHTSDNPTAAARTITVTVHDGDGNSAASTMTVNVTPVNDAAAVDLDASNASGEQPDFAAAWTEGDAAEALVAADATITDPDTTNLASMTVAITGNFVAGDTIGYDTGGTSIGADYNAATGVLTLTGPDTVAHFQTVLRSLTFASTSDDPTAAVRTVTVTVNDGTADSVARTTAVTVTPVNDVPTLAGADGTAVDYTEGDAATPILPAITVADSDDTSINSATVVITNVVAGDTLAATVGMSGIAANYTAETGTLTLTGAATKAVYQQVLRTVTFIHTSDDPTAVARTITVVVNDGDGNSAASTVTVNVTPVNDAPTISLDDDDSGQNAPNFSVTYTENDGAVTIVDGDAVIADGDDTNIESMTITITNVVAGDVLDANVGATGLVKSYNAGTGALTLTGTASVADYQSVLRTVSYASTSDAPTDAARTVTFVVNDGTADSAAATATINVQSVNDNPTITVPGAQSLNEDATLTLNGISIADVDAAGSDVTVTLAVTHGILTLTDGTGLTGVTGAGTATVELVGTVAAINTALAAGVVYAPAGDWNGGETLTVTVNDGGATGSGGGGDISDTVAITVNAVNDDPVITVPAAQTVNEDGSLVFSAANSNAVSIADVDSAAGDLTVTLEVAHGTLALANPAAAGGAGDGTATVTLTGTVAEIATAIATITYTPDADYN
ncbi:MAG: tandem-95 repeat protein, partial [Planctomycetes bacterium]|nr:tandem-95 repeat protein [Planctomycetota bacterium]